MSVTPVPRFPRLNLRRVSFSLDCSLSVPSALALAYVYHDFWWLRGASTFALVSVVSWAAAVGSDRYLERLVVAVLCGVAGSALTNFYEPLLLLAASTLIGSLQVLPRATADDSLTIGVLYRLLRMLSATAVLIVTVVGSDYLWGKWWFAKLLWSPKGEGRFSDIGAAVMWGMLIAALVAFRCLAAVRRHRKSSERV